MQPRRSSREIYQQLAEVRTRTLRGASPEKAWEGLGDRPGVAAGSASPPHVRPFGLAGWKVWAARVALVVAFALWLPLAILGVIENELWPTVFHLWLLGCTAYVLWDLR